MLQSYPDVNEKVHALMNQYSKESPNIMNGFMQMHKASTDDGVLSAKVKELIALAIGITVRCDGCIALHVNDALKAGAKHDEIVEAIGVAILMGGGPSVVYGAQALEALKEFEREKYVEDTLSVSD